jgi:3'(2'), 5'-bisphosphate nucleotidase
MQVFGNQSSLRHKPDGSPVTEADEQAEEIILEALETVAPDIPVVAEEAVSRGKLPRLGEQFFLVDPLDGTKEFVRGSTDFTVNIALVAKCKPVFGIVYAPATSALYMTLGQDHAAFARLAPTGQPETLAGLQSKHIHVRQAPEDGLVVATSRSHASPDLDRWLPSLRIKERKTLGSSLKFCLVAAGEVDLYPRLGPTCEWDIAAGHAVLSAAGGHVTTLDGKPMTYGKVNSDFVNPGFLAFGAQLPSDGAYS